MLVQNYIRRNSMIFNSFNLKKKLSNIVDRIEVSFETKGTTFRKDIREK